MKNFKKHHHEHLDDTRGAWRPSLVASMWGPDGHPIAWKEIVIVSCPGCGIQFGVGGDANGPQINEDGTTTEPVVCHHCQWSDNMTFDGHTEPHGREHFAKLKDQAANDVKEARAHHLKRALHKQMLENLDQAVHEESERLLAEDPDHAKAFLKAMKNLKKGKDK